MQIFSLKPGRSIWREVLDQTCHGIYAVCLMTAFVLPVPAWAAAVLVMCVAVERELEQHNWNVEAIGRQDLIFWALATSAFVAVYYSL